MTWWKTSREFLNSFNRLRKMRNAEITENDPETTDYDSLIEGIESYEQSNITEEFKNRHITIVPSYSTKAELKGLESNQIYVVEVFIFFEILIFLVVSYS